MFQCCGKYLDTQAYLVHRMLSINYKDQSDPGLTKCYTFNYITNSDLLYGIPHASKASLYGFTLFK